MAPRSASIWGTVRRAVKRCWTRSPLARFCGNDRRPGRSNPSVLQANRSRVAAATQRGTLGFLHDDSAQRWRRGASLYPSGRRRQECVARGLPRTAVIVYFYPAAMTPGCTTQAIDFTASMDELDAAGVHVIGISPDVQENSFSSGN